MSKFIDIDSILRDRENYSSPADFVVTSQQCSGWYVSDRTTLNQGTSQKFPSMTYTVKLMDLVVPYSSTIILFPRLYVTFSCTNNDSRNLIFSISDRQADSTFVAIFDKIQNNDAGDETWIHYKCHMSQVMKFPMDSEYVFKVTTNGSTVLPVTDDPLPDPPNPLQQVKATFSITPYIRTNEYSNHLVNVTSI